MDKVTLEFKTPKNKTIEYNGVEINVIPFLGLAEQTVLINRYIEQYFGNSGEALIKGSEYRYIEAEYNLFYNILQTCTNVDTENLSNDFYVDLWFVEAITDKIINYANFRDTLEFIVDEIKSQKALNSSIGKVVSDLVTKAYVIMDKLSDITPEEIEKARESGLELIKKLEESSVLGKEFAPKPEKKERKKAVK